MFAFFIYITIRGQLPGFMALFTKKSAAQTSVSSTSGNSQVPDALNKAFGISDKIASALPKEVSSKIGEVFSNMGLG